MRLKESSSLFGFLNAGNYKEMYYEAMSGGVPAGLSHEFEDPFQGICLVAREGGAEGDPVKMYDVEEATASSSSKQASLKLEVQVHEMELRGPPGVPEAHRCGP